jgi:hypothetical protein
MKYGAGLGMERLGLRVTLFAASISGVWSSLVRYSDSGAVQGRRRSIERILENIVIGERNRRGFDRFSTLEGVAERSK